MVEQVAQDEGLASSFSPERIKQLERETRRDSFGRAWYKFSRNRLSVVGLATVILLVLLAIFANYVTPYPRHAGAEDRMIGDVAYALALEEGLAVVAERSLILLPCPHGRLISLQPAPD